MAVNFASEIVCDEWNRLPEWVVNVEGVNKFKGNLNCYPRENRGFKKGIFTLSFLEPFELSNMLITTVLGKLGNRFVGYSSIC